MDLCQMNNSIVYHDFGSTVYNEYNYMSLPTGCTHILGHVILDFGYFNGMAI